MNDEERHKIQREQADENARAIWRSINEAVMPLVTTILVLAGIWLVVANVWVNRVAITAWIGHNLLIEVIVAIPVLGIVAGWASRV